jgi:predicted transglutaminase-like cysteine proteinase
MASAALCAAAIGAAFAAWGELGFSRSVTAGLIERHERQFGQGARGRLQGWKDFVRSAGGPSGQARGNPGGTGHLSPVNSFFNRLEYSTDLAIWGAEDYWATPSEFLASNSGDCEDYAIAKYFTLKELGVPVVQLRLVYAKTWKSSVAHMVLAYYSAPGADPLILDSLQNGIELASKRPDLIPVYTFNDEDILILQQGAPPIRLGATSTRKWRDVLEKLNRELTY